MKLIYAAVTVLLSKVAKRHRVLASSELTGKTSGRNGDKLSIRYPDLRGGTDTINTLSVI